MQKENSKIVKGAMILGGAVFISRLIGMLYKIPLNGMLGNEIMGIYTGAFQVYMLLLTFSAVGIPVAISKLVSEREAIGAHRDAFRVFKVTLVYSGIISLITSVLLFVFAENISMMLRNGSTDLTMPLKVLSPTLFIVTVMAVIRGYFQGLNDMVPSAISQVIEQMFNALTAIGLAYLLLVYSPILAVTGATLGPAIGGLVGLIFLLILFIKRRTKIRSRLKATTTSTNETNSVILKKVLLMIIPILMTSSIFSLIGTIDQMMIFSRMPQSIEYLRENEELDRVPVIGLYEEHIEEGETVVVAMETEAIVSNLFGQYTSKYLVLVGVPVALVLQIAAAAMPGISASTKVGDMEDVRRKIVLVLKVGMLLAIPAAIGLSVLGGVIVPVLYRTVPDGGELLIYGAIVIIPMAIAQLTVGALQGMGRQKIPVRNAAIACGSKVLFNAILLSIPQLHIYAVIHSTTLCYLIYCILNLIELKRITDIKFDWNNLLFKPLIAAIIMGVVAYTSYVGFIAWRSQPTLGLMIAIGLAIAVYGVAVVLVGAINKEELESMPFGNRISRYVFK